MTRYRFFAGKGGVGKTTCAAATAASLAAGRRRVLVVSLDPAHSLGDALARRLGRRPVPVDGRRGRLHAVELDADRALARWLAPRRSSLQTIAERGTYLDHEDVARLLEQSLPGVDELVGLVELARLAGEDRYDDVVVDTAPTGHTLRLLAMPATLRRIAAILADMHAKHRFLAESLGGRYRPDRADALVDEIDAQGRALQALLTDGARCGFTWVLRPEALVLEESLDGVAVLDAAGLAVTELLVNGVRVRADRRCGPCAARAAAEAEALRAVAAAFPRRPLRTAPALAAEPRGLSALRALASRMVAAAPARGRAAVRRPRPAAAGAAGAPSWLEAVAPPGVRLVLVGGKGGVGKTTCAAALALALGGAAPERRVLLLSTDPAHSLGDVLQVAVDDEARPVAGAPPGLRARELDAARAFQARRERYRAAVDDLFTALVRGARFDVAFDRAVVEELIDLAPPGLDELFGVLAVLEALAGGPAAYDVVVVDTAPTGHALRLLAMPAVARQWVHALLAILLKYRAVLGLGDFAADLVGLARDLRALDAMLHDPARARFVAVTRAATLPRLETERLRAWLRRSRVPAGALVVNAVTTGRCLRCRRARAVERRVLRSLAARWRGVRLLAPSQSPPPRGVAALRAWAHAWAREAA